MAKSKAQPNGGKKVSKPENTVMVSAIKRNVPIPERAGTRETKYPLAQMNKGDMFEVSGVKSSSMSSLVHQRQKKLGMKFAVRELPGGKVGVWRVE